MTQLTHSGLPDDLSRWKLFHLIEVARRKIGLSKGAVAYLRCAITATDDGDFAKGRICAFWTSVTEIAAFTGIDRRQVARIEAELIATGLIAKSCTDRARRSGSRLRGVIRHEFGINLAPLIRRATEIQALARQVMLEQAEAKSLRRQINSLFARIRQLGEAASDAADTILPNRRPSTLQSFQRLKAVAEALEAVLADFSVDAGGDEMSHLCDISPLPNTNSVQNHKTCRAANRPTPRTTPAQVWLLASNHYREAIALYAAGLGCEKRPDWRSITMAARDIAMNAGISGRDWGLSCDLLGEPRAALCLLIADRNASRSDGYRVRNVAAAFVGMARTEARQGAVVDALLGELTAFARGRAHV